MEKTVNWIIKATDKTQSAFKSVDSKISSITKGLKTFAGFAGFATIAAGVGQFTRELVQLGSELQDASEKLGVSAEKLQVLKFAAEQTGSSFEALQAGLAFNTKLTGEATRGNEKAAEVFRLLGINANNFAKLPIDQRLGVIADQLSKVDNPAQRLDLTLKALGRGGAQLVPLLAGGAGALAGFERQLRSSNSVLTDDQVKALDDAGDAWDAFFLRLKVGGAPILTGTIDLLERMGQAASDSATFTGLVFGRETEQMLRSAQGRNRGPTRRFRRRGSSSLSPDQQSAIEGAPGIAESNAQLAAIQKAAEAAAKAQEKLTKEAVDYAAEVQSVVDDISKLSREANRAFDNRAAELNDQFRDPLETLKSQIDEVNSLWLAGAVSTDVANRAVKAYGDQYAATMDVVVDESDKVKDANERLFQELKTAANGFARDLTDIFFDSTQSIGDMFKNLANTIAKALFTQGVTEPLINAILGTGGSSGGWLASLFGGARAGGGPVSSGRAYLVGERGPEFFVPGMSGKIVPNGEGSAPPISVNLHIRTVDPQTAAQTIAANERLVTGMVRRAMERAGYRPNLA